MHALQYSVKIILLFSRRKSSLYMKRAIHKGSSIFQVPLPTSLSKEIKLINAMKEDRQTPLELGENWNSENGKYLFYKKNGFRMIKGAVFILCVTGFAYQSAEFLVNFYTYPTVINVNSERVLQFPTPALTFCSRYMMKFDKYCELYEGRCDKDNITGTVKPIQLPHYFEEMGVIKNLYFNTDEAFPSRGYWISNEKIGKPFMFYDLGANYREVCFGYGYGLNETGLRNMTIQAYEKTVKWVQFHLSFRQAEYVFLYPEPYGTLYIHSPFLAFKTFGKRIIMKKNKDYSIHVNLKEEILLPSPYDTDCTDYISLWQKNGGRGPLSREMCQNNCLSSQTDYFENDHKIRQTAERCDNLIKGIPTATDPETIIQVPVRWEDCKCYVECKDECLKLNYDYTFRETPRDVYTDSPYSHVKIFIDDNKVQINTCKPQYMDVERFSYVGGFLGCWLGISIWTMSGILWKAKSVAIAKAKNSAYFFGHKQSLKEEASHHEKDLTKETA